VDLSSGPELFDRPLYYILLNAVKLLLHFVVLVGYAMYWLYIVREKYMLWKYV